VVHARCAGLDISKKDAKVCVWVAGVDRRKSDVELDDEPDPGIA
jgi:hypothetical protein